MKRILTLIAVLLTYGCASGTQFQPITASEDSDKANVYIYRNYKFAGSAASPKVYIDDLDLGQLHSGNYIATQVHAGTYHITIGKKEGESINWAPDTISQPVTLEEKGDYYFRMDMDNSEVGWFIVPMPYAPIIVTSGTSRTTLNKIDPEKALEELSKTKLHSGESTNKGPSGRAKPSARAN